MPRADARSRSISIVISGLPGSELVATSAMPRRARIPHAPSPRPRCDREMARSSENRLISTGGRTLPAPRGGRVPPPRRGKRSSTSTHAFRPPPPVRQSPSRVPVGKHEVDLGQVLSAGAACPRRWRAGFRPRRRSAPESSVALRRGPSMRSTTSDVVPQASCPRRDVRRNANSPWARDRAPGSCPASGIAATASDEEPERHRQDRPAQAQRRARGRRGKPARVPSSSLRVSRPGDGVEQPTRPTHQIARTLERGDHGDQQRRPSTAARPDTNVRGTDATGTAMTVRIWLASQAFAATDRRERPSDRP